MKCEEYRLLIEDYVDGGLGQSTAARVTAHTSACAECSSFYQQLSREQEVYARYQRDVEVGPALWASIDSRLKQERAARPMGLISRVREWFAGAFSAPMLSPAFAAVLVILAIGVTVFVMSRLNTVVPQQTARENNNTPLTTPDEKKNVDVPAPAPNTTDPGKDNSVATNSTEPASGPAKKAAPSVNQKNRTLAALTPAQLVRDAEQKYLAAIAMLSRDVNRRRSQLDPMMLARFDASLSEIDRTIKETREVVRGNPGDPIALQYLLAAYSKKVDVLREMTND